MNNRPHSVLNPKAQAARVNYAARCILSGKGTHSRGWDNCFEMGDGDEVVAKLIRRAHKNPALAAKLPKVINLESANKAAIQFGVQPLK